MPSVRSGSTSSMGRWPLALTVECALSVHDPPLRYWFAASGIGPDEAVDGTLRRRDRARNTEAIACPEIIFMK